MSDFSGHSRYPVHPTAHYEVEFAVADVLHIRNKGIYVISGTSLRQVDGRCLYCSFRSCSIVSYVWERVRSRMTRSLKLTGTRSQSWGPEFDIASSSDTTLVGQPVASSQSPRSLSACQYAYLSTHASFN